MTIKLINKGHIKLNRTSFKSVNDMVEYLGDNGYGDVRDEYNSAVAQQGKSKVWYITEDPCMDEIHCRNIPIFAHDELTLEQLSYDSAREI